MHYKSRRNYVSRPKLYLLFVLFNIHPLLHFRQSMDEMDCMEALNVTINEDLDILNVTRSIQYYDVKPTKLRLNSVYYKFYCIGCNSLFAWVIPLASLFYLNICTINGKHAVGRNKFWPLMPSHFELLILALRKIKKQQNDPDPGGPTLLTRVKSERKVSVFYRNSHGKTFSPTRRTRHVY